MYKYKIVIPSYDRPNFIKEKTLKVLKEYEIPIENIYIFVSSLEQQIIYLKENPEYNIIIGVPTLQAQRNFIQDYFKLDEHIVSMDDDIYGIYMITSIKNSALIRVPDLDLFLKSVFERLIIEDAKLAGIYPCKNQLFMNNTITTDLKFILGTFYCFINDDTRLVHKIQEKEDYYRTLQYYIKYGKIVRFNNICIKTKFLNYGGMGLLENRHIQNENDTNVLLNTYPAYFRTFRRKTNNRLEIAFKKNHL